MPKEFGSIALKGRPGFAAQWTPLLREGVGVEVRSGESLRRVMEEVLGMAPNYVTDRVLTVFLDASPVDDIDAACVREGSVLALGAAMPGLAGIAMRRGSPIRAFRSGITADCAQGPVSKAPARITVKLFNLVADESGPELLSRGVLVPAERLRGYLSGRGALLAGLLEAAADGAPLSPASLAETLASCGQREIRLVVEKGEGPA